MQMHTEILPHLIRLKGRHSSLMEGSDQVYARDAMAPGKRFTKSIKHTPECVLEPVYKFEEDKNLYPAGNCTTIRRSSNPYSRLCTTCVIPGIELLKTSLNKTIINKCDKK